ncbi:MAG: FG-GAP-like repeat-containing protein, partial [Verrucomicrobiales bacterium]
NLVGTKSNRFGLGARVIVLFKDSDQTLTRYLTSARGFMSCPEPRLHFGLGDHQEIAVLTVHWPSGHEQSFENLKADRLYSITEPMSIEQKRQADSPTLFVASTFLNGIRHVELPYDDYVRQPLLPNKHSQLGPGIAFADVDGDGQEDFYLAQGAGTPGQVYVRKKRDQKGASPFLPHAATEDITPLFFDADGDNDQDLYVVSGGVEGEPGDAVFKDRLYLNDSKGNFTHAPTALPDITSSGGPVAAADYDKDGDVDLFVGGRIVPGRYPETPQSQLLRNEKGAFQDVAAEMKLHAIGMVTGAVWADTNGDTWPDLIVATEWGPIHVFENDKGTLRKSTSTTLTGWWSSVAAGDLDGDGDTDFVAGNVGLNTKYKATSEKPELLYYGDLDGTGRPRILEAKFEGAVCLPHRGYSCSSHAMPALKSKLTTFHSFASKSLESIYSAPRLEKAQRFEANGLESGMFLNDGKGQFTFAPLPRLAQSFPIFGIALRDFTSDGKLDLYLIGNSHSPQRETGSMDGGISLLLKGDGRGHFDPVWPNESGLVVAEDAKGLAITDLNGDKKPDIVVSINNGPTQAFLAR